MNAPYLLTGVLLVAVALIIGWKSRCPSLRPWLALEQKPAEKSFRIPEAK